MRSLIIVLSTVLLVACSDPIQEQKALKKVVITPATTLGYKPYSSFNARLVSRSEVAITAFVSGELIAVHFKEGEKVNRGQALFDIDPAPYEAAKAAAEAEVLRAQAASDNAVKKFNRAKELIDDNFISQSEYDQLESEVAGSHAAVRSAEAQLETANVNLAYTKITASTNGVIGRSSVNVGDIVGPESGTLTTLVGEGLIDVIFQVSDDEWFKFARRQADQMTQNPADVVEVIIQFSDGSDYEYPGTIDYVSNRVNENTATVELRATVENPLGILRPGQYVIAKVQTKEEVFALEIPQRAIQVDQQGTYVMVVEPTNLVKRVNVELGQRTGENTVVKGGLIEGQNVIVSGLQQVRPGQEVTTQMIPISKGL